MRKPIEQNFWYRSTKFVMRRAVPIGVAIVALLLVLGAPFLGIKWGFPDDRVLPQSLSAHQVGDELRTNFAVDSARNVTVVIPDTNGVTPADLDRYASALSQVPDVSSVSAPGGTFAGGRPVGPPSAATGFKDGSAFLTVGSTAPLYTEASETQLDRLRAVTPPAGQHVQLTGMAQINRDSAEAITSRLPMVLGIIAAITFVLLFLLTGSVVLPLKALVLNVLSLTAAFGALVWIFQDGHLGALGTTPTGTLVANMPVLLFCIAFGLSMDYEVFLVSRIRENWLKSGQTRADNDESVALGLARTGRVVTAAALLMAISFAALIAAKVAFMRMFGVGPDARGDRRRNPGPHDAGAGVHACARPVELVGAEAAGQAARAHRDQRGRGRLPADGRETRTCRGLCSGRWLACRSSGCDAAAPRAVPASSCARKSWTRRPNCCWKPGTRRQCPSDRSHSGSA